MPRKGGSAVRVGLLIVVTFAAISLLGLAFLSASLNAAILYLPRVLLAFLLLLAGMVVSELVRRQVPRLAAQMAASPPEADANALCEHVLRPTQSRALGDYVAVLVVRLLADDPSTPTRGSSARAGRPTILC